MSMRHVAEVPASAEGCVRKSKSEQARVFRLTGGTLGPARIVGCTPYHAAGRDLQPVVAGSDSILWRSSNRRTPRPR